MTIKELIDELKQYDSDNIVRIWDGYGHQEINSIDAQTDSETGEDIISINANV